MEDGFAQYSVAINGDEEEQQLHVEERTRQRLSSDRGIKSFVNVDDGDDGVDDDDDSAGNHIKHLTDDHLHRDSHSGGSRRLYDAYAPPELPMHPRVVRQIVTVDFFLCGRKLFVGGVAWETSEETFSNYFCKYGEIADSVIMMDKLSGRSRGFGFVTFADPAVADKVLEEDHVIDGRVVEVKRTVPREDMHMHMQVKREQKTKKIFVGGIPPSLTEDELKEYFSSYGSIAEHQIMLDHNTGRSRGFGFVTFENEDTVDRIFSNGKTHELGGKQVEIKKAVPKRAGSDYANDARMHHGGRASKSYGGFSSGAAEYGGGYNGKMRRGYGAYGGGYGDYGSYVGNYGGGDAGFYGGYGGYGYGFGFWGPMYSSGGYGGSGYGIPDGYGGAAGYGGGGKGYGSGGSKGYGNAGAVTGRYHPYQK